jgi:hypothetical protein
LKTLKDYIKKHPIFALTASFSGSKPGT